MAISSLGDLSQSFLFQKSSYILKSEVTKLTTEMATGQVADVRSKMNGNYSYLSDLEYSMRVNSGYEVAAAEAAQFTDSVQSSLALIQQSGEDLAGSLINLSNSALFPVISQGGDLSRGQLDAVFSALNTDVAGRKLFSGAQTDASPLPSVETLLDELETVVLGATSAADAFALAEAWFDDPAGFDAIIYQGANANISDFRLTEGDTVSVDIRANDQAIKDLIMSIALPAVADRGTLGFGTDVISRVNRLAGERLLGNSEDIVALQARVGTAQERIENISSRLSAEQLTLEFARNQFLEADPYDTANRLEGVRFQLESLYTVTARLSGLNLVNFIR